MLRLLAATIATVLPPASAVGTFMGPWAALATMAAGAAGAGWLWRHVLAPLMSTTEELRALPAWRADMQNLEAAHADTRDHLEAIAAELGAHTPRPTRHARDLARARRLIRPRAT